MSVHGLTRRLRSDDPPALVQLKLDLANLEHYLHTTPVDRLDFVKIIGALEEAWARRDRLRGTVTR